MIKLQIMTNQNQKTEAKPKEVIQIFTGIIYSSDQDHSSGKEATSKHFVHNGAP